MTERGTITIPAPIAPQGAAVQVRNYRKQYAQWEDGIVSEATYNPQLNRWSYRVELLRRSPSGHYMHLFVSDDSIMS